MKPFVFWLVAGGLLIGAGMLIGSLSPQHKSILITCSFFLLTLGLLVRISRE